MMKKSPRLNRRGSCSECNFIDTDFPFNRHMAGYSIRILRSYGLVEQMLGYVLSCMTLKERRSMVKSFYTDTKKSGDNVEGTGNFRRVISGLSRPGNIDDDIVEDILDGTTVMNERAVVHVLTSWLRVALVSHDRRAGDGLEKRSEELKKTFGLDDRDISLLIFLCCTYAINVEYLKEIQSEMTYSSYLRLASIATGLPMRTVHERLGSNGRLFKTGIIESHGHASPGIFHAKR